jgi:hypothetical protein
MQSFVLLVESKDLFSAKQKVLISARSVVGFASELARSLSSRIVGGWSIEVDRMVVEVFDRDFEEFVELCDLESMQGGKARLRVSRLQQRAPRLDTNDCYDSTKYVPFERIRGDEVERREVLAEGFFGKVVVCNWRGLKCVLKTFKENVRQGQEANFMQELVALNETRHPKVVLFVGAIVEPQAWGILFEFMEGGSLASAISSTSTTSTDHNRTSTSTQYQPLLSTLRQKLVVVSDVALGLSYLHGKRPQLLHRDLSTANILLDQHGRAKVRKHPLSIRSPSTHHPLTIHSDPYLFLYVCYLFHALLNLIHRWRTSDCQHCADSSSSSSSSRPCLHANYRPNYRPNCCSMWKAM